MNRPVKHDPATEPRIYLTVHTDSRTAIDCDVQERTDTGVIAVGEYLTIFSTSPATLRRLAAQARACADALEVVQAVRAEQRKDRS